MRCSTWSRRLDEDPAGTAARAVGWLAIEQPGPWGARAATDSHLDARLGAALEAAAERHGSRLALIRRPQSHPGEQGLRRVFAAGVRHGRRFLLTGCLEDLNRLRALDWEALAGGRPEAVLASMPELSLRSGPVLLVCSNGRRDACCAMLGRPVALSLYDEFGEAVWESTHLGGHRFAPTSLLLPHGYSHARLDPVSGARLLALAEEGRLLLPGLRGSTALAPAEQAADAAVRRSLVEDRVEAVRVVDSTTSDAGVLVTLEAGGRIHSMLMRQDRLAATHPESCGKQPVPLTHWRATPLPPIRDFPPAHP